MARVRVPLAGLVLRRGGWVPAFPLVFALAFGAVAWWAASEAQMLERYGIEGEAEVTAKYTRERRDSEGQRQVSHFLAYRFLTESGIEADGERAVGRRFFDRVVPGDRIWIRYVSHDPARHEIEPGNTRVVMWIFGALSALGWGGVGVGLWWLNRRLAPALRAVRDGEVREARVTARAPSGVRVFGSTWLHLIWHDARGVPGRSSPLDPRRLEAWPIGSVVVIYVDPVSGAAFWEEELAPGTAARLEGQPI